MSSDSSPRVRSNEPPAIVLSVMNPIFRTILGSPLHGLVDKAFMLVHLTGRKTGRRYSIVVGRHEIDGVTTAMTSAPWRLNARGGADADVTTDGRTWHARAELVEDPDAVADAYAAEIQRFGWKGAQRRLGITMDGDRPPTQEELREAAEQAHLSLILFRLA